MNENTDAMKLYKVFHDAFERGEITSEAESARDQALAMNDPAVYYAYYQDLISECENDESLAEAIKWLLRAAEAGYADANLMASLEYRRGYVAGGKNYQKALEHAVKYVEQTGRIDEELMLEPAREEDVGNHCSEVDIEWWNAVEAMRPTPWLEYCLGTYYYNSTTEKDRGLSLLKKSAEGGEKEALIEYGCILSESTDEESLKKAVEFLESARQKINVDEDVGAKPFVLWPLIRLYDRHNGKCFDKNKAFVRALELFDGYDEEDEVCKAAYVLYWHLSLATGDEVEKQKEALKNWHLQNPRRDFPEDEGLLCCAKGVHYDCHGWDGFWWKEMVNNGDERAAKVWSEIQEFYRLFGGM